MKIFSLMLCAGILSLSDLSWAQKAVRGVASSGSSRVTYDLSASFGTYNEKTYNEINLGLNWFLADWLNWRNSLFSRFGGDIDTVSGLDSSARFQGSLESDGGSFGIHAFLGPGVRLASQNYNAVFGEAGLIFKLGGLKIGGGVKSLYYFSDRQDSKTNLTLPKNDNQVFIILSGSGSF